MKKSFLIFFGLFVFSSSLLAQYYTTLWERSLAKGNYPSFMGSSGTLNVDRGFGYGIVGGKEQVYLVARKGGTNVIILNAATGDSVGKLSTTGISGGTFTLNDAEVSSDGKIFACNLTTNASTSAFKIYRWDADTTSVPLNVINFTIPDAFRLGDVFSVIGSTADNSITIYAHASAQDKVYRFTTTDNGISFTATTITLSNGVSGTVANVAPTGTGAVEFYTKSAGRTIARFTATGTLLDTLSGAIVASASSKITYWADGGKKFLAAYNYGAGNENLRLVDVTNGLATGKLVFKTNSLGSEANGNGTGDVAARVVGNNYYKLVLLGTNNGIASYKTNFLTIAQARQDLNLDLIPDRLNDTVTVRGTVISPNFQTTNNSYYIWDGTAGITTFKGGVTPLLNLGDIVDVVGKIGQFNGLTQIQPFADSSIVFIDDSAAIPAPTVLTLAQYKANPEMYEGSLVGFVGLTKVSGTWPASGASVTLKMKQDNDTVDVRIDSDTDIDGQPEPVWPRDVIGMASQFSSGGSLSNGYQILPRYYATDFLPAGTIPVELVSFSANVVSGSVALSWKTSTEKNNLGFAVQRSKDGKTFNDIGFVNGSGTTTEAKSYSFIDMNLGEVNKLYYRLRQIDYDGTAVYTSIIQVDITKPVTFNLAQNYPNPFNPSTTINFTLPVDAKVTLKVFDILGNEVYRVVNDNLSAGNHIYSVSFENSASGVYIYSLEANGIDGKVFKSSKKMTLMR
jgi:hypothetical protein